MVRGNWQRRVEKTEARRAAAKQRKQRQSDRSKNSLKGKELLAFLDSHTENLIQQQQQQQPQTAGGVEHEKWVLHVWVDSVPADAAPFLGDEKDDFPTGKRRNNNKGKARSNSCSSSYSSTHEQEEMTTKGGGGGSNKKEGGGSRIYKGRMKSTTTSAHHHPRSKQQHKEESVTDNTDAEDYHSTAKSRLCRSYFFTGKYQPENQRKKSGVHNIHHNNPYSKTQPETLATILGNKHHHHPKRKPSSSNNNNNNNNNSDSSPSSSYPWKEQLDQAAKAAAAFEMEDGEEEDVGTMDMLYYFPIHLRAPGKQQQHTNNNMNKEEEEEAETPPPLEKINMSDIVSKSLSSKSCSVGSIVYVTLNNYMLFDRHRNGMVMSEKDLLSIVSGGGNTNLSKSAVTMSTNSGGGGALPQNITTANDNNNTGSSHHQHLAVMLPGPLLEHIVSFLPDSSGILMCSVCRSWYQEIGQSSPSLWRTLLQRRGWPLPPPTSTLTTTMTTTPTTTTADEEQISSGDGAEMNADARNWFRHNFIAHYKAVRDMNAIQVALPALLGLTRGVEENEMVFQVFLTRRGAPQEPNACSSVKVWSSKRVLASYEHDCTLRLFEAIEKSHSSSSSNNKKDLLLRGCREVVCFRAAPYQNTKKRTCALVGMDLDDEMIGCLCHVNQMDEIEGYYLIVVSREEFLCSGGGGTSEASAGKSTDNDSLFCCSINIGEAVLHYLLSLSDIDHRLVRLYELFEDSGGELPDVHIVASRNVVACGYGRFMVEVSIWIPEETEDFVTESVLLDRKLVLLSTSTESVVWMGDSHFTQIQPRLDDVRIVRETSSSSAGRGHRSSCCSLAVASSWSPTILTVNMEPTGHIVDSVDIIESSEQVQSDMLQDDWVVGDMGNGHRCRPIVITPSDVLVADNLHRENDGRLFRKSVLSFYSRRGTPDDSVPRLLTLDFECETIHMMQLRDHHVILLCRSYEYEDREKIEGVLVSVASRKVIHRVCLLEDATHLPPAMFDHDIPILLTADKDTVGVGVSWSGMILTGQDVRSVGRSSVGSQHDATQVVSKSASKKKKKKRQSGKGNKKDGFARGMSLRG